MIVPNLVNSIGALADMVNGELDSTVVWLLCHYPEHPETDERVAKAAEVFNQWRLPIWVFGSASARYVESVEVATKKKLVAAGVDEDKIFCSADFGPIVSLDTVQEAYNILATAEKKGVRHVVCISNPLQLLQVFGLLFREKKHFLFLPTTLRDWRWWYVSVRLALIPLSFAGIAKKFVPLQLVRKARANWCKCPF